MRLPWLLVFSAGLCACGPDHFQATEKLNAPRSLLWDAWTDVENWPDWDTLIASSSLDTPFVEGARGVVESNDGLEMPFTLTHVQSGDSYTFSAELPGGHFIVRRTTFFLDEELYFQHDLYLSGISRPAFAALIGGTFETGLPGIVRRLKTQVEERWEREQ